MLDVVIRYPSGREDHVTVGEGRFDVGSDPAGDIVISDGSVGKRQLRVWADEHALEVENLASKHAVWLNEKPLFAGERSPFVFGDRLRLGSVVVFVQEPYQPGTDKTKSPDGVRKMRASVMRDVRAGWRGYRRVMEKLSCFVSRDEAKIASTCYASGGRAFVCTLAILLAVNLVSSLLEFMQWYRASAFLSFCEQFASNAAILLLVGRYRMAFPGRILYPLLFLSRCDMMLPDCLCADYWSASWVFGVGIAIIVLWGWLVDYGAGFVFEERRRNRAIRFSTLILSSCLVVGLTCLTESVSPEPLPWYLSIFAETPCLIWAFAYKRILATTAGLPVDSLFVAEIASRRVWRRLLCQGFAVALIVLPAVSILLFLGDDERHRFPTDNPDVLWTDEDTRSEAWFWNDRGRYFRKSDLNANRIFQLPISLLAEPASSRSGVRAEVSGDGDDCDSLTSLRNELAGRIAECDRAGAFVQPDRGVNLSDFATNVCALVCAVSTNVGDVAAYAALCDRLSPYRVSSTNFVSFAQNLGKNAICVVCDSIRRHPEYGREAAFVCSARFQIGVSAYTRDRLTAEHATVARRKVGILLAFVLGALALLILFRRGADSAVGFWLGLLLFAETIRLAEVVAGFEDGIPYSMKYAIWQGAFTNPLHALVAVWLSMASFVGSVFQFLGRVAQAMLFVLLCWPTLRGAGKWRRRWIFVGKLVASCAVVSLVESLCGRYLSSSLLIVRMFDVLILGLWGWMLRRRRRHYTEIPVLGFGFFAGWLLASVAVGVFLSWLNVDATSLPERDVARTIHGFLSTAFGIPALGLEIEPGLLLSAVLPILALACWIWLFIKQRFMNVLSLGGMTLITGVFAMPLISRLVGENLASGVSDSYLISRAGMQLLSAIVIVIVAPVLMRVGQKTSRRIFQRNVYRMDRDVESAIEKVFDESANRVESVYNVLSCLRISSFAFYERVAKDDFSLIVSKNWPGRSALTLSLGEEVRAHLGRSREPVDFLELPFRPEMFFVSFELWRIHLETNGALMLPICLGTSVRGLLFVSSDNVADMPSDRSLVASLNSFGLTAVTPR